MPRFVAHGGNRNDICEVCKVKSGFRRVLTVAVKAVNPKKWKSFALESTRQLLKSICWFAIANLTSDGHGDRSQEQDDGGDRS